MVACTRTVFMLLVYSGLMKIGYAGPPKKKAKTVEDCELNWIIQSPIILYKSNKKIILPEKVMSSKIVKIKSGEQVTISCSQSSFKNPNLPVPANPISTNAWENTASLIAQCNDNGKLLYQKIALSMPDIQCSIIKNSVQYIKESIKDMKTPCASKEGKLIGIGFETNGNYFYPQIKVCFDTDNENTLYTEHTLHGKNYPARIRDRSGSWSPDGLFTSDLKDIYNTQHQQDLFQDQLGQTVKVPQRYIARGHMSPNADFVTQAERRATFHYINALPQWQAVNNGNWKRVEQGVQDLAEALLTDIKIISGGYGTLELEDTDKKLVPIYLANYKKGPNKVPVPELTWKIVIAGNKGVAFVVINNPTLKTPPAPICIVKDSKGDICSQLTWLAEKFDSAQRARPERGYTYCCTVSDFRSKINTLSKKVIITNQGQLSLLI